MSCPYSIMWDRLKIFGYDKLLESVLCLINIREIANVHYYVMVRVKSMGVDILLVPALIRSWNMSVKPPPITSASNSDFPGRMISVTLWFQTYPTRDRTNTTRKSKGASISSCLQSIIQCITMNRSDSTRNWQVFTTPSL